MKWRNSKERELIAQGGCREQTLPTKHNPNPDLSDPQPSSHQSRNLSSSSPAQPVNPLLEATLKTRQAFNEAMWNLPPPPLLQAGQQPPLSDRSEHRAGQQLENNNSNSAVESADEESGAEDIADDDEEQEEEIDVT